MTRQLMIYERAVPVSSDEHRDLSVVMGRDYGFARELNAVPLVAAEVAIAAREFPVVFTGSDDAIVPTAILGAGDGANPFVAEDGSWTGRYVPAFLRRYPFVFSRTDDGSAFTLCLDEKFSGLNRDGVGERLFDAEGSRTQFLGTMLDFATQYQAQFDTTRQFSTRLRDLDILEEGHAQFRFPGGRTAALSGFEMVSREKLRALPDEILLELARSDALELCHAHLASLANITPVAERIADSTNESEPNLQSA